MPRQTIKQMEGKTETHFQIQYLRKIYQKNSVRRLKDIKGDYAKIKTCMMQLRTRLTLLQKCKYQQLI